MLTVGFLLPFGIVNHMDLMCFLSTWLACRFAHSANIAHLVRGHLLQTLYYRTGPAPVMGLARVLGSNASTSQLQSKTGISPTEKDMVVLFQEISTPRASNHRCISPAEISPPRTYLPILQGPRKCASHAKTPRVPSLLNSGRAPACGWAAVGSRWN